MDKGKKPVPLYETLPTASDKRSKPSGETVPAEDSVERLRQWGKNSKL